MGTKTKATPPSEKLTVACIPVYTASHCLEFLFGDPDSHFFHLRRARREEIRLSVEALRGG